MSTRGISSRSELPHAYDAERSVIGALLKFEEVYDTVSPVISNRTSFYHPQHRIIFEAICSVKKRNEPVDITTVVNQLNAVGELGNVGGRSFLVDLCEEVVTSANVATHAQIVREDAIRRHIITDGRCLIDSFYDRTQPVEGLLAKMQQLALDGSGSCRSDSLSVADLATTFEQQVLHGITDTEEYLPTGIPELDDKIVGLFKKEMVIVAGPPSMGKTSFAIGVVLHNAVRGAKVLYVTLDQSQQSVYQRFISHATGISRQKMVTHQLSDDERALFQDASRRLTTLGGLVILDRAGLTITDIAARARNLKARIGLDCIVIDYLQQIKPETRSEVRTVQVQEISGAIKDMAKDLNVVCIAVSQLSRSYEGLGDKQYPRASMLRDSGALEQDANLILFPWVRLELIRKRYGEESAEYKAVFKPGVDPKAEIVIGKQKDGATGIVDCRWNPERMAFYSERVRHQGKLWLQPVRIDIQNGLN